MIKKISVRKDQLALLSRNGDYYKVLHAGEHLLPWLNTPEVLLITLDGSESLQANATSFAALNAVLSSAAEEWLARSIPFKIFYLEDETTPPSGQNSRADAS